MKTQVDDEVAIRGLIGQFDEAWNRHDAKALAALHAETAETVNRFGMYIRGRAEHEEQFAWLHGGPFKGSRSALQSVFSIRFIRPDVAQAHTTWETPQLNVGGQTIPREDMVVSYLVVKGSEGWRFEALDLHNVESALGQTPSLPTA
jgi:uncharacterized protein (TIGR02246 family)